MSSPLKISPFVLLTVAYFFFGQSACSQNRNDEDFAVIAYFHGDTTQLGQYPLENLTHICFSFLHLKGNALSVDNSRDSVSILYLTSLKKRYPGLKILLSLGGWGGCRTCSEVFSSDSGRSQFAKSTVRVLRAYSADGLDLDWEYPGVSGYPDHPYSPADSHNFTLLVRKLRKQFGKSYELTFAAGAIYDILARSIEWKAVMPYVDLVNLMTYDLKNGFSKVTGHHSSLYSTPRQPESSDLAVRYLDSVGVPARKIVLGIPFYARVWSGVPDTNNGLYQPGEFSRGVPYKVFDQYFLGSPYYGYHWDSTAQAPYRYDPHEHLFATFDDRHSVALKVEYALNHHLGGIKFWELTEDTPAQGLLSVIKAEIHRWKEAKDPFLKK